MQESCHVNNKRVPYIPRCTLLVLAQWLQWVFQSPSMAQHACAKGKAEHGFGDVLRNAEMKINRMLFCVRGCQNVDGEMVDDVSQMVPNDPTESRPKVEPIAILRQAHGT